MTQSKEEKKLQSELIKGWKSDDFYCEKTHEMLSSGKPDLRTGRGDLGQLDVELKHRTTGVRGLKTGVSPLQRIKIDDLNNHGMPAVALVWDEQSKRYFLTLDEEQDVREIEDWRWIDPVVKRVCSLVTVYQKARRYLSERGYDEAARRLTVD